MSPERQLKPMVRSNVCLNCSPLGLFREVRRQADWFAAARHGASGPKNVLVIGGSMGYGLASRLCAAFTYRANTLCVSFEKAETESRQGTPGHYNNKIADKLARAKGLVSISIEADAFSDETKRLVAERLRELPGKVDLVVYSVASGVRVDPDSGVEYRSALKPIGAPYTGKAVDYMTGALSDLTVQPATPEEVAATVKVMGGEDWERWMKYLADAGLLADGVKTVAYSYIGPDLARPIYREGAIGKAKEHIEASAARITASLASTGGRAWVSVNKALVTRASAVIPGIALYIATLFKVMKEHGTHEGCAEQALRLFADRLYAEGPVVVDANGLIRIDDLEMDADTQREVAALMARLDGTNVNELTDLEGVRADFLGASGFGLE